jgi:hypothetical protein
VGFLGVGEAFGEIRTAGPAEVQRHGLAARRPAGGRPEVVNDHTGVCETVIERDPMNSWGFRAMDVPKPYKFIWFGDIHGPKPYKSTGSRATNISHTPVASNRTMY